VDHTHLELCKDKGTFQLFIYIPARTSRRSEGAFVVEESSVAKDCNANATFFFPSKRFSDKRVGR
jgi:hypothetical protein